MSEVTRFLGEHYTSLDAARNFLGNFLCKEGGYIGNRNNYEDEDDMEFSRSMYVTGVSSFATIKTLLACFPILASERFDGSYPLTYFIWNGFDADTLETIYLLYPEILSKPEAGHPNLLELLCSSCHVPDETILWLLSKCDNSFPLQSLDGLPRYIPALAKMVAARYLTEEGYSASTGITEQIMQAFAAKEPGLLKYTIKAIVAIQALKCQLLASNGLFKITVNLPVSLLSCDPKIFEALFQFLNAPPVHLTTVIMNGWQTGFSSSISCGYHQGLKSCPELKMEGDINHCTLQSTNTAFIRLLVDNTTSFRRMVLENFRLVDCEIVAKLAQRCEILTMNHCSLITTLQQQPSSNGKHEHGSTALWRGIAKVRSLCELSIRVISNCNSHQEMKTLKIEGLPNEDTADALVAVIGPQSSLEILEVANVHHGRIDRSKNDLHRICEALCHNDSIKTLQLDSCSFGRIAFREAVKMVLNVVKEKNTCLREVEIRNEWLSAIPLGSLVFHDSGRQVQYALRLNEFGRGKLRDKTATFDTIIEMITKVNQWKASKEQRSYETSYEMVTRSELAPTRGSRYFGSHNFSPLDRLFKSLRNSVGCWSHILAGNHAADTTGILYGLMRESPHLWCNTCFTVTPAATTTSGKVDSTIASSRKRR